MRLLLGLRLLLLRFGCSRWAGACLRTKLLRHLLGCCQRACFKSSCCLLCTNLLCFAFRWARRQVDDLCGRDAAAPGVGAAGWLC